MDFECVVTYVFCHGRKNMGLKCPGANSYYSTLYTVINLNTWAL